MSFVGLLLVPLVGNAGDGDGDAGVGRGSAKNEKRRGRGIEEVLRGYGTRSFLRGVKSHYMRMGRVGLREEILKPHVGGAGVHAFCQTGKNAIRIAVVGGLIVSGPTAADPQELKVTEHATTDAVTDTGAPGDSAGDILTFANEVYDAGDKTKIGTDQGICFRTVAGKAWECFWTLALEKGQITVEGPFLDAGDSVLAVTGGTGDYAGARGDMVLSAIGTDGKAYSFTYRLK